MNIATTFSKKKFKRLALADSIAAGLVVGVTACKLPKLQKSEPGPTLPDSFNGQTTEQNSANVDLISFFNDPLLAGLIVQSFADNQELRILAQDIRIAQN